MLPGGCSWLSAAETDSQWLPHHQPLAVGGAWRRPAKTPDLKLQSVSPPECLPLNSRPALPASHILACRTDLHTKPPCSHLNSASE